MLKPDRAIVKEIKAYDRDLSVRWNNERKFFEIWYKRPSGMKLITPVVEGIYVDGGDAFKFAPLDYRIIDWLYLADTKRTGKNWKWIARKRYNDRIASRDKRTRNLFENIAKDNWNLINMEVINPLTEASNWIAPDCSSNSRKRVMARTGENFKKLRERTGEHE